MKPFTREVLDHLTEGLVSLGLRKVRRGTCVIEVESGICAGISIQHRDWPDGVVTLSPHQNAYWSEFDKISAVGWDRPQPFASHPAAGKFAADLLFTFSPLVDNGSEYERFLHWAEGTGIPYAKSLAHKDRILAFQSSGPLSPDGPAYPEHLVAIRLITHGVVGIDSVIQDLRIGIKHPVIQKRFDSFIANLRTSAHLPVS